MVSDFIKRVEAWGPTLAPHLRAGVVADDARVRRAATAACNFIVTAGDLHDDAELVSALIRALGDTLPRVRLIAAHCLGKIRDSRAIVPLISQLSAESDADVAETMCESLGHFRDQRALGVMDRILTGRPANPGQVALIVQALCSIAELDREQALPRLIRGLGHAHPHARVTAVVLLARLKEPRALQPLLARLADPHLTVVQQTVLALLAIEDERTVEPLLRTLEKTWWHDVSIDWDFTAEYMVNYRDHVQAIDRLPFSPDQRKRWEALRPR